MKVLVATIGSIILSSCAMHIAEPLCLPSRPVLEPISIEEQVEIDPNTLIKLVTNEEKLKSYVRSIERISVEHNKQFRATCAE